MLKRSQSLPRHRENSYGRQPSPRRDYRQDYNTMSSHPGHSRSKTTPGNSYVQWQRDELDKEIEKMDMLLQELHTATPIVPGTLQRSKKHYRKELASRLPNSTPLHDEEEDQLSLATRNKEIFSVGLESFRPEEIAIDVTGSKIKIHARRNDYRTGGDGRSSKEYKRTIYAPGMDLSQLKGTLNHDGTLNLVAPTMRNRRGPLSQSRTLQKSVTVTPNYEHRPSYSYDTPTYDRSIRGGGKPRFRSVSATRELEYDRAYDTDHDIYARRRQYSEDLPPRAQSSMSYRSPSPSRNKHRYRSSSATREMDFDDSDLDRLELHSRTESPKSPVYSTFNRNSTLNHSMPTRSRPKFRSASTTKELEYGYEHDRIVHDLHSQPPQHFITSRHNSAIEKRPRFRSQSATRELERDYNHNSVDFMDDTDYPYRRGKQFNPKVIVRRDEPHVNGNFSDGYSNGNTMQVRSPSQPMGTYMSRTNPHHSPTRGYGARATTPQPQITSPPAYHTLQSARTPSASSSGPLSPRSPHSGRSRQSSGHGTDEHDDIQVFVGQNVCALLEVGRHYKPEDIIVKNIIQDNRFLVEIRPVNKQSLVADFKREFMWPVPVNPNTITAVVKGGLLKITAVPLKT